MVTDSISGTMKMFGRKGKSDPLSSYLFNKLKRDGLINYEVVIAFRGGPCYAVDVDTENDPDCPGLGDSTNLETSQGQLIAEKFLYTFNYTTWRYTPLIWASQNCLVGGNERKTVR